MIHEKRRRHGSDDGNVTATHHLLLVGMIRNPRLNRSVALRTPWLHISCRLLHSLGQRARAYPARVSRPPPSRSRLPASGTNSSSSAGDETTSSSANAVFSPPGVATVVTLVIRATARATTEL